MLEVDYGCLLPTRNPVDRGREDFEVYGDDWQLGEDEAGTIPCHCALRSSASRTRGGDGD